MSQQRNLLPFPPPAQESWREEFSRAKKFREATQKRSNEKALLEEAERVKRKIATGRSEPEP